MLSKIIFLASVVIGIIVGALLLRWRTNRPCWLYGHDKRYLALRTTGCVSASHPNADGRGFSCMRVYPFHKHQDGDRNIYIVRWGCRKCPALGEDCLDNKQDWRIEHEALVPDTKKWANWSRSQDEGQGGR